MTPRPEARYARPVRVLSWNVNGLRSVIDKGFRRWLSRSGAGIVGLQEVRAREDQLVDHARVFTGFHRHLVSAERAGYSGVALLARQKPDVVTTTLGDPAFDVEGRFQLARFGALTVVNAYFPNGNGPNRDNSRVPYKLAFYRRVFELLEADKQRGAPILVMGDFNTAHREIDLARPRENVKTSGFTPDERAELDRWIRAGWVDTFRRYEPGPGHYSWWSQRFGVREKNIGWRIDYVLASPGAIPHLTGAFIHAKVKGSDHCPVGVDIDDAVMG
ncbi:Exodeoxyribonuclease III [Minicystis rosea]|nr:Exodeoxyribonuclease III [Minicystis rosea]